MLIYNSRFENYQSHNAYMKVEEYDNLRQSNAKTLDVSAYSTFAMINAWTFLLAVVSRPCCSCMKELEVSKLKGL